MKTSHGVNTCNLCYYSRTALILRATMRRQFKLSDHPCDCEANCDCEEATCNSAVKIKSYQCLPTRRGLKHYAVSFPNKYIYFRRAYTLTIRICEAHTKYKYFVYLIVGITKLQRIRSVNDKECIYRVFDGIGMKIIKEIDKRKMRCSLMQESHVMYYLFNWTWCD